MNKMVIIAYNEAIDDEVMEILSECGLKSYSKTAQCFGSGMSSGTHLGNDIWPGLNNMVYVVASTENAEKLMSRIKEARKELGREGVKAFMLPVEDVT